MFEWVLPKAACVHLFQLATSHTSSCRIAKAFLLVLALDVLLVLRETPIDSRVMCHAPCILSQDDLPRQGERQNLATWMQE
jgi:hypothetical protein